MEEKIINLAKILFEDKSLVNRFAARICFYRWEVYCKFCDSSKVTVDHFYFNIFRNCPVFDRFCLQ